MNKLRKQSIRQVKNRIQVLKTEVNFLLGAEKEDYGTLSSEKRIGFKGTESTHTIGNLSGALRALDSAIEYLNSILDF